jgi:hypothetical protein
VSEIGKARARDEPDVPGAEHADLCHAPQRTWPAALLGRQRYLASGARPLAIAIIVSFESSSRSVFTTQ